MPEPGYPDQGFTLLPVQSVTIQFSLSDQPSSNRIISTTARKIAKSPEDQAMRNYANLSRKKSVPEKIVQEKGVTLFFVPRNMSPKKLSWMSCL